MLLIGDVGATTTRLALVGDGLPDILREARLRSRDYGTLAEAVRVFLREPTPPPDGAVFAVAGPVVGGRAELTNLGWSLDEGRLALSLGLRSVRLVNDLVAMAQAIPRLGAEALHPLQEGRPVPGGALAVVAPGTGLGKAFLAWDGRAYRAYPSEGGHADFAPMGPLQGELLAWLHRRIGHVSYERVCSGRAIPELYRFLKERGTTPETPRVAQLLAESTDRTPVIVSAALAIPSCPLSTAAVELFAAILAAEAGNMALHTLAVGGVYLGGGLPRRLLPVLARPDFLERFRDKGRLSPLLAQVPLYVVVQPSLGLAGAIEYARTLGASGARE